MTRRTSSSAIEATEKQAEACRLRRDGCTYPEIGAALGGISEKSARQLVTRGMRARLGEPAQELIDRETDHLMHLRTEMLAVLRRDHIHVNFGKVAYHCDENGAEDKTRPILDDGPKVQAAMALMRISESLRKLLGADAPTRHRLEVITEDVVDAEIRRLEEELRANDADAEDRGGAASQAAPAPPASS